MCSCGLDTTGSRVINGLDRGTAGTYQRWADLVGDQSFTFDKLLPYFKRSPRFTPPNTAKIGADVPYDPSAFDARGGPVSVTYSNYQQPITPPAASRPLASS